MQQVFEALPNDQVSAGFNLAYILFESLMNFPYGDLENQRKNFITLTNVLEEYSS